MTVWSTVRRRAAIAACLAAVTLGGIVAAGPAMSPVVHQSVATGCGSSCISDVHRQV